MHQCVSVCGARQPSAAWSYLHDATLEEYRWIALELVNGRRAESTPIASSGWGTYEHQEVYSGKLEDFDRMDENNQAARDRAPCNSRSSARRCAPSKLHWFGQDVLSIRWRFRNWQRPQFGD